MVKNINLVIIGLICGITIDALIFVNRPAGFHDVRLFEIIQLVATFCIGGYVAYFFSNRLSNHSGKVELICSHLTRLIDSYEHSENVVLLFMSCPSSKPTKEVSLIFKDISSKLSIIKNRLDYLDLDKAIVLNIVNAHETLNEIVVNDSWGANLESIMYSEDQIQKAKKEYSIIHNYLVDLRFSLYQ